MSIPEPTRAVLSAVAASLGPVRRPGLNMVLPKEVIGGDAVPVFGHVPGVKPGAKFRDRGQLYVAGLHATLMKGIHAPASKHPDFARGAYSVVMSGGYVDDEDMGESFWYTGEGGIDAASKRQVKDQSMQRGSNAALRSNCVSRTPVRVIRGFVSCTAEAGAPAAVAAAAETTAAAGAGGGVRKEKGFVYEGLYVVQQYKQEPSKDGPLVCKFLMQGIPGHSTVNTKVEFGIFGNVPTSGLLHARRLAGVGVAASRLSPPSKCRRVCTSKDRRALALARDVMLADIRRRYKGSSALLNEDISGGQEAVPIPLVNEVNSDTLPPGFQYTRQYVWAPGVFELVAPILKVVDQEMSTFAKAYVNGQCGLAFNRMIEAKDKALGSKLPQGYDLHMEEPYNKDGCLLVTDPCGVHECGPKCKSAKCRLNKQLSNGVRLPLEVFMTAAKGWGVRCQEPIPAGAFVCCYVGQLVTDHMADVRKGVDHYLFNLDFFVHIYMEIVEKGLEVIEQEIPLHKIPPVLPVSGIRQLQINAAAAARTQGSPAAAAATANATIASTAEPSGKLAAAGAAAAPAAADAYSASFLAAAASHDGVLPRAAVPAAAKSLLASCTAFTSGIPPAAGGGGGGGAPSGARGAISAPSLLVAEAAAAAAACDVDPGAFYLQQLFGHDQQQHPDAAISAAATQRGEPRGGSAAVTAAVTGEEYSPILVLDARSRGNVGRFINHSCDGNLTIQAVFAGEYHNTFLYHVGLYACTDIPAMTELTYNYGYHSQANRGDGQYGMECHCGAPNCVGQLM